MGALIGLFIQLAVMAIRLTVTLMIWMVRLMAMLAAMAIAAISERRR